MSLCDGPCSNSEGLLGCHNRQHLIGEATFWRKAGIDVEQLIEEFCIFSPKRAEIKRIKAERADG